MTSNHDVDSNSFVIHVYLHIRTQKIWLSYSSERRSDDPRDEATGLFWKTQVVVDMQFIEAIFTIVESDRSTHRKWLFFRRETSWSLKSWKFESVMRILIFDSVELHDESSLYEWISWNPKSKWATFYVLKSMDWISWSPVILHEDTRRYEESRKHHDFLLLFPINDREIRVIRRYASVQLLSSKGFRDQLKMSKCKNWSYELQAPSRSQRRYSIVTICTREELVLGTERDEYASRPRKKKK